MTKAELIEQAAGLAPASQLARLNKAQLESLIKGDVKEKEVEVVEKIEPVNEPIKKDDPCDGCRFKGNRHQCGSCINYRR